jgi:DnaK suppressor protein
MANDELDREFIEHQRIRLEELRAELMQLRDSAQVDRRDLAEQEEDFTQHDSGDMSYSLFTREVDATLEGQIGRRLERVQRALRKIEEGTYGLSDDSGEPIPKGRLEAVPEAVRTVEEQGRDREAYRRHRGGQI